MRQDRTNRYIILTSEKLVDFKIYNFYRSLMIRNKGERKRKSGSVKGKSVNKANDFIHRGPFHRFHSIAVTVIDTTDGHGKSVRRLRFDFEGKSDCMIAWPSNGNRTSSNIPGSRSSDRVIGVVKKSRARARNPRRREKRNDSKTMKERFVIKQELISRYTAMRRPSSD